jgi:hypothetical protein
LFRCIHPPQQAFRLHLVVQCDRIPIVAIGPSERAVIDEHALEVSGIFERLQHWARFAEDKREVAFSDRVVGKLDLQLVISKRPDAEHINHHFCTPIRFLLLLQRALILRRGHAVSFFRPLEKGNGAPGRRLGAGEAPLAED